MSSLPVSLTSIKEEPKEAKRPDSQSLDEGKLKNDDRKTPVNWKDSRGTRVAVSSPMSQHQSYIQYLHAYPYPQMYDPSHPAYRAVSPVLMHSWNMKSMRILNVWLISSQEIKIFQLHVYKLQARHKY